MTQRKDSQDFLPDGRPSKYKEEYNELAYRYSLLGAIDKEMAAFFDVSESTLNLWKLEYPEFSESIKRGKSIADSKVAESLYQRAIGYSHSEDKIFQYQGQPIIVPATKHYPPDTQAASLWLRNRQPDKWRDSKDITIREPEVKPRTTQEIKDAIEATSKEIARLEAAL